MNRPRVVVAIALTFVAGMTVGALLSYWQLKDYVRQKPKPFRHLVEVIRDGDFQRAKELIAEGKQQGEYNRALQVACVNHGTNHTLLQNLPIIQALLDARADPDAGKRNQDGFTPLWLMAGSPELGSGQALDMLIKAGAALDVQERQHGSTPLMNAAEAGSIPKVRRLLKAGANPKIWNEHGENALMVCSTNCVPVLVKAGLDVNAMISKRMNVLMWAAARGLDLKVQALLAHGAEVDVGSPASFERRRTGLHNSGLTALMYAANHGHTTVVRTLLDAGADVNVTSNEGWSALMLATAANHEETAVLLRERGATTKGLEKAEFIRAVRSNNASVVRAILRKGVSADAHTPFMETPLEIAARQGSDEVLQMLLKNGADLSRYGELALRMAEREGHKSTVEILKAAMRSTRQPVPHWRSPPID